MLSINKQQQAMLEDSTFKLFLKYTIPNIFNVLIASTAVVIDAYFVGNYIGAKALAGVNIVMPLFALLFGMGIMITSGGIVRYAKYIGENNKQAANAIFTKSILVVSIFSIVVASLGFLFSEPILYLLGADSSIYPQALEYFRYVIFFATFYMLAFMLPGFLRSEGHPMLILFCAVLSLITNIALDYIFIVHMSMGVKGASFATGIAQMISVLIFLTFIFVYKDGIRFTKQIGEWKEIFIAAYNGLSEMVNEMSSGIMIILFNRALIKYFGVDGVAAYGIVNYFFLIVLMISYGTADAILPLQSANFGAKKISRANSLLYIAILCISIAAITIFSLADGYALGFIKFFIGNAEPAILNLGVEMLNVVRWGFLVVGINIIIASYLTALHHATLSALIAVLRSFIFPIAGIYLLPIFMGAEGIYHVVPMTELLTIFIAMGILIVLKIKQKPTT